MKVIKGKTHGLKMFKGLAAEMRQLAEADPGTPATAMDSSYVKSHTVDTLVGGRSLRLIFTLEHHVDGKIFWHLSVSFWDGGQVSDELCLELCGAFFDWDASGNMDVEEGPSSGFLPYVRHFWQHKSGNIKK